MGGGRVVEGLGGGALGSQKCFMVLMPHASSAHGRLMAHGSCFNYIKTVYCIRYTVLTLMVHVSCSWLRCMAHGPRLLPGILAQAPTLSRPILYYRHHRTLCDKEFEGMRVVVGREEQSFNQRGQLSHIAT